MWTKVSTEECVVLYKIRRLNVINKGCNVGYSFHNMKTKGTKNVHSMMWFQINKRVNTSLKQTNY